MSRETPSTASEIQIQKSISAKEWKVHVAGSAIGAAIKVALDNLLSYPVEEIGLQWNFSKDLEKLKQSILTIQEFLDDAETKQVTDKPVQRWLMKLEAVAFKADYVFDVLNYEVLRKKVMKTDRKKVSSFLNSKTLVFRSKMAREIKDIKDELKSINQEATELGLQIRIASVPARGAGADARAYPETDSFSMDPVFVGRENDVGKIVEMVTSNSSTEKLVSVLPIVGMGGLGKTTLTREVYNAQKINSHFEKRIWVDVGLYFDPLVVFKKILESLTEENVDGSRDVVLRKLQRSLKCKRYLLVLDNFWDEDNQKWDNDFIISLRGISDVKGNVIMVTTRNGNVATIVKDIGVYELGVLTEENCWSIIKAKAFGGEVIPAEFETIGKNIARRCQGLPFAAQVVGSLLRSKTKDEWVSIDKNWLSKFGGDGNIVSKMLKLSFDHLTSPSLKKCFALCSIIPRRWWIYKDEMIQLWMAEGYLQTEKEENMETVGNREFDILLQSSLLHVLRRDYYGNVERFDMHDLVHDLALSILCPKSLSDMNRVRYVSSIDDSSSISKEYAECLRALFFEGITSKIIFSNFKCLHTLVLIDEDMNELPNEIGELICLRYLDISHTRMECLPDSIGNLYHLQTLRATIESGRRCYLRKLPYTFEFLINLRHLHIPNIELPPKIGKLISLQTLPYFMVGDKDSCRIMELGSLNNLKGELEIHNLERVCDKEEAMNACLFHKPNILKLKLVWNERGQVETNDEHVLEGLQPHPALKSLEIKGFESKSFPLWTSRMSVIEDLEDRWIQLDNLLEVRLSDCKECEEIPMLGHLPHLKSLSLHRLSNVKYLGSTFYGIKENKLNKEKIVVFPALENLELVDMANLTAWTKVKLSRSSGTQPYEALGFARLEHLKITNCRQLKSAPRHFPCLKELEIDNMKSCLPLANICVSLTTLTKLIICNVDGLVCLPKGLFNNNRNLSELEIRTCNNILYLVSCLRGGGSSLKKLVIHNCLNFQKFPEDLHTLNSLEELTIGNCPNLKSIPYPSGKHLSSQGFTSLRELQFFECSGLTNLPCEILESCALSLQWLRLTGSMSLTNLPEVMSILQKMPRLTFLDIEIVPKVTDVATEIGSLHSLQTLVIGGHPDCRDYVSFKASLDHIFPALLSLGVLILYGMKEWDAIPEQLLHLTTLNSLMIFGFGIEELPEWIGELPSLTDLYVFACPNLRRLASKKAMLRLTDLEIFQCPLLEQNVEQAEASDSEWHKISHIHRITVDSRPFYGRHAW